MKKIYVFLTYFIIATLGIVYFECVNSEKNSYVEPNTNIQSTINSSTANNTATTTDITTTSPSTSSTTSSTTTTTTAWTIQRTTDTFGIGWVLIPEGTFAMGGSDTVIEQPIHTVHINSFYMTETEVTVAQYCSFLNATATNSNLSRWDTQMSNSAYCGIIRNGSNPYTYSVVSGRENYPIVYVNWTNSCDFCNYVGGTLSSEAQWEYACGGGSNHYMWSLGDVWSCNSYCTQVNPCNHTAPDAVKSHGTSNIFGLWDMSGNVSEWCLDFYSDSNYGSTGTTSSTQSFYKNCYDIGVVTDPINMYSNSSKIIRGGSWDKQTTDWFKTYFRVSYSPSSRYYIFGFRCVK